MPASCPWLSQIERFPPFPPSASSLCLFLTPTSSAPSITSAETFKTRMATPQWAPLSGLLQYRPPRVAVFLAAALTVVAAANIRTWRPHIWFRMATSLAHNPDHLMIGKASISQLLEELESRRVTSKQLVETYLARIEEVNAKVHAVSEVNSQAIDIAIERDRERESGQIRGILHGIPILVKDVFCTMDGMNTTAGFSGFVGARFDVESAATRKLRDSGAIILGKATLTEWLALRDLGRCPNGWSPVGGWAAGLFHDKQDPGGSSTGSASATALGLAAAALGTETDGSIVNPARSSGVIGLKPTSGLVSRSGILVASEWQDSVGVLAKSILDAAHVLTAIAGNNPGDPSPQPDPRDVLARPRPADGTDFRQFCNASALKGMRIAVPRHVMNAKPWVAEKFEEALEVIKSLGATVVDGATFPEWTLQFYENNKEEMEFSFSASFRNNVETFLGLMKHNPNNLHTLRDVVRFTEVTPKEAPEQWNYNTLVRAADDGDEADRDTGRFMASQNLRLHIGMDIARLLDKYECDILAVPLWTETPSSIGGNPHIAVPMPPHPTDYPLPSKIKFGRVSTGPNIPTSIMFIGRRFDDGLVISAAYSFEQATHHIEKFRPIIGPTAELFKENNSKI
ncbi:amidase signature enzyme [Nemania sp. FL0031]|nr:amidase signature enzyme [Nemania sp. FL0031]